MTLKRTPMTTHSRKQPNRRAHLTIADVCTELDIARSTFTTWRRAGTAPRCLKLPNGQIRVRRTDFEKWLDSRQLDNLEGAA